MKNIFILLVALTFTNAVFSQKKGKRKKVVKKTSVTLANATNVVFEMNKKNGLNQLYLLLGDKKDTLLIKSVPELTKILPESCVLKSFFCGATPFLNITWTENNSIGDAKSKLESITKINNEIWETSARNQAFANVQTTTNIKEIVYLDRLKNASETQERNRKEGFEFALQANGDVSLTNKSQVNTMVYNAVDKKYKAKKK